MKKSPVTRELVNIFPSWSKVRKSDQSVGFQVLNTFGVEFEEMQKQIRTMRDNQYVSTANLDEIDLTFRVTLPTDFAFQIDSSDPTNPCPRAPSCSGLLDGNWYDVDPAVDNDIRSFWYDSVPDRFSLANIVSGVDHELLTFEAQNSPQSGLWYHHLDGGDIWVECVGGIQYLTFEENELRRGNVRLQGITRKGTVEDEVLVFPWDQNQKTLKDWKKLTNVAAYNIESGVQVTVRSGNYAAEEYLDFWNLSFSEERQKIDTFWGLGLETTTTGTDTDAIAVLDKVHYTSDEWQQLVLGFSDKVPVESWELIDETDDTISGIDITVSGVDIAVQPYSDRLWVADRDNMLFLYDLGEQMVSGVKKLAPSTAGSEIQIELDTPWVVLGQEILFTPWHARPIRNLIQYSVWYQTPSGGKFSFDGTTIVPYSSTYVSKIPVTTPLARTIGSLLSIPVTERGEYLIVFEGTFADGVEHQYRTIVPVNYKSPLAKFDLSSIIPDPITGVDFDADQKLWVKTADDYYQLDFHTDVMLIDYDRKIIYFKEEYDQVVVNSDE